MNSPIVRPEPHRVVPRAVVDALIADADREISALELRVTGAVAAADEAEARVAELGIDERSSAWATVQLDRFVTRLRADADVEARAVVQEAEVRARMLVAEAEADAADEARQARVATPAPLGLVTLPVDRVEPVTRPVGPAEPASVDAASVEAAAVEPVADVEPVSESPAPEPEAVADGDAVFRQITPEALADDETAVDEEFWPADPERKRRFGRARVRAVAAPTLAGLLVVAAVVLRVA
jgi:hypothetical protein